MDGSASDPLAELSAILKTSSITLFFLGSLNYLPYLRKLGGGFANPQCVMAFWMARKLMPISTHERDFFALIIKNPHSFIAFIPRTDCFVVQSMTSGAIPLRPLLVPRWRLSTSLWNLGFEANVMNRRRSRDFSVLKSARHRQHPRTRIKKTFRDRRFRHSSISFRTLRIEAEKYRML